MLVLEKSRLAAVVAACLYACSGKVEELPGASAGPPSNDATAGAYPIDISGGGIATAAGGSVNIGGGNVIGSNVGGMSIQNNGDAGAGGTDITGSAGLPNDGGSGGEAGSNPAPPPPANSDTVHIEQLFNGLWNEPQPSCHSCLAGACEEPTGGGCAATTACIEKNCVQHYTADMDACIRECIATRVACYERWIQYMDCENRACEVTCVP